MIERIDHIIQAKELMLSQFEESELLNKLIESWMSPIQELEDSLHDFMAGNGISVAVGEMLDIIGEYFGVSRDSREDDEYRSAILARGVTESVDGTTDRFLSGMASVTQAEFYTFYDYYPRTVYAHIGGGYSPTIYSDIKRLKPAGRHIRLWLDIDHDSMIPVEIVDRDNSLVTSDLEQYTVVKDGITYNLIVNFSGADTLEDSNQYLAEPFDEEFFPLAEEMAVDGVRFTEFLVDDQGEFILDNLGERFQVIGYT